MRAAGLLYGKLFDGSLPPMPPPLSAWHQQHFFNEWHSTLERKAQRRKGSCCAYRKDDEGVVVHLLGAQGKRQVGDAAVHHLSATAISLQS